MTTDPRLRTIAEHAVASLERDLRSAEYWSCAMEGEAMRSEQWHPRSWHAKQARKSYEHHVKQRDHLREALAMAREILGQSSEVET